MRAVCIRNRISAIGETNVRERIRRSVHLDGPMTDLTVGREYSVQALEERDGGVWIYLHTISASDYPYPFPAEMFEFRDNTLPAEWSIRLCNERGGFAWKRITFSAWANDDSFYEKLVEGDPGSITLYRRNMRTS